MALSYGNGGLRSPCLTVHRLRLKAKRNPSVDALTKRCAREEGKTGLELARHLALLGVCV